MLTESDMTATETDSDREGLEQWDGVPLPGMAEVGMFPKLGGGEV